MKKNKITQHSTSGTISTAWTYVMENGELKIENDRICKNPESKIPRPISNY